jgi:hypothetical protein
VGIAVYYDARVHILDNQITGGASSCGTAACISYGILAEGDPTIEIRGNAILGGTEPATGATGAFGMRVLNGGGAPTTASIVDNMIAVGGSTKGNVGVQLDSATNATIAGNTLEGMNSMVASYAIVLASSSATRIQNNLSANVSYGVDLTIAAPGASCFLSTQTVTNDAFVEDSFAAVTSGCSDIADTTFSTNAQMAALGWTSLVRINTTAECNGDSGCVTPGACATDSACLLATLAKAPLASVTFTDGFKLATAAPCAVTQGGVGGVDDATDYYGTPRPAVQPSIGAHQFAGTCTP